MCSKILWAICSNFVSSLLTRWRHSNCKKESVGIPQLLCVIGVQSMTHPQSAHDAIIILSLSQNDVFWRNNDVFIASLGHRVSMFMVITRLLPVLRHTVSNISFSHITQFMRKLVVTWCLCNGPVSKRNMILSSTFSRKKLSTEKKLLWYWRYCIHTVSEWITVVIFFSSFVYLPYVRSA